ncbi:FAD/NAD(P)-binding protein [Glarea lozoyensis ATCC 20868]|uniref:FAD/NAD(P)-binding protein n=1 Tax=Glarea lozoyensis (strain ATCC 20868 / MF5171) TaxID=1116229 RepID=S3D9Q4_GLAL2|nr:FAD/NAD(P)-binding protein [Glarea lozoyensis ATCC 20868]EPE28711.1 FAD/NAD(P)-binding protein [Glarea lozoyensis ATCC 20868]
MPYFNPVKRPVTIVGAGVAGLSLARVLLSRGVPSVIYEKASSAPRHNYAITLYPLRLQSLLKALLPKASDDKTSVEAKFRSSVGVGSEGTMNPSNVVLQARRKGAFRANRGSLERYLATGLDIRWNSAVERVEKVANGGWVLHFEDGKTVESKYVVAADGIHSPIRQLLLPDEKPTVMPCVVYSGKRQISREVFDASLAQNLAGNTLMEYSFGQTVLQFSVDEMNQDQVSVRWTFVRDAKKTDDPLFKPDRSFEAATETPPELFSEIEALGIMPKPWNSIVNVESMKEDKTYNWLMRSIALDPVDVQNLRQQGLFIVGDAANARPILWGAGANRVMTKSSYWADVIAEERVQQLQRSRKSENTGLVAGFIEVTRKYNDTHRVLSPEESTEKRAKRTAKRREWRKLQKEKRKGSQKKADVKGLEKIRKSSGQGKPAENKEVEDSKVTDLQDLEEGQKPSDQEKVEETKEVKDSIVVDRESLDEDKKLNGQEKPAENKKWRERIQ